MFNIELNYFQFILNRNKNSRKTNFSLSQIEVKIDAFI